MSTNDSETHSTYVQCIAGGGFFASCQRCGPDLFLDRATLAEAEGDAQSHGALRHIYSLDALAAHGRRS